MQGLAGIRMYQFVYNFLNLGMETLSSFLLCNCVCDCAVKKYLLGVLIQVYLTFQMVLLFSDGLCGGLN